MCGSVLKESGCWPCVSASLRIPASFLPRPSCASRDIVATWLSSLDVVAPWDRGPVITARPLHARDGIPPRRAEGDDWGVGSARAAQRMPPGNGREVHREMTGDG